MLRKRYDYRAHVQHDVEEYIANELTESFGSTEEMEEYLNEVLWAEDSVTGNGSGSYTFSRALAEEYLLYNRELIYEAYETFELTGYVEPEALDVTIRCMLLGEAIANAVANVWQAAIA